MPSQRTLAQELDDARRSQIRKRLLGKDAPIAQGEPPPIGAMVGGLAGNVIGAVSPVPGGSLLGGTIGSGLGQGIQGAVEQSFDAPGAPKSAQEAGQRIARETAFGLAGETVGRGLAMGARLFRAADPKPLLRMFSGAVTPEAQRALEFIRLPNNAPGLTPAEATDARSLDLIQNVTEHSLIGGSFIRGFKDQREQFFTKMADEMLEAVGPQLDSFEAGKLFVASVKANEKLFKHPANVLYNTIRNEIAPKRVTKVRTARQPVGKGGTKALIPRTETFETLEGGLRSEFDPVRGLLGPANINTEIRQRLPKEVTASLEALPKKPYTTDLMLMRTDLRAKREALEAGLTTRKDPSIGALKQVEKTLDNVINNTLRRKEPGLLASKIEADRIWSEGSKTFQNKFIKKLNRMADIDAGGNIEGIVKSTFTTPTQMHLVKRALRPDQWDKIARRGMEDLIIKNSPDGVLNGKTLERAFMERGALGPRGLQTAVGKENTKNWQELANALKKSQEKQAAGEGRMLIQLTQASAAVQLLVDLPDAISEGLNGPSAAILIGPAALAFAMTRPKIARLLIRGVETTPKNRRELAGLVGRLSQALIPREIEEANAKPIRDRPVSETGGQPVLGSVAADTARTRVPDAFTRPQVTR